MSSIYSDIILDYYRYPRNKGQITSPRIKAKDSNPLCGDVVEIQMQVDGDNRVTEIKFDGHGCAISQASASMLTELVEGKTLELIGGELSAVRMKCALLSLKVLKTGVYTYLGSLEESKEEISNLS